MRSVEDYRYGSNGEFFRMLKACGRPSRTERLKYLEHLTGMFGAQRLGRVGCPFRTCPDYSSGGQGRGWEGNQKTIAFNKQ